MEAGIKDLSQPAAKPEEEAMKRNTDCVYFLASPLTCKKGGECEYRHSEYARVNPRDCRFWLNGNCLNRKCSFRHPPLDGLLGTTVTPEGLSSTTLQSASLTQPPAAPTPAYNLSKQAVPCIYYQKGLCLKGDRCSFKHGVKPINNAVQQPPAPKIATSFSELQSLMKGPSLQKCTQQPKIPQMNTIKSDKLPPPLKPASRVETASLKDGALTTGLVPFTASNDELHRYKPINVPLIISGNSVSRPHHNLQVQVVDEHSFHNGREAGEILGESSPGFDVLVDDELEDSEYYYNEHKRRHLDSGKEFTHRRSVDYTSLTKPYNDAIGYDRYGHVQDRYAIEQRRASAERVLETPSMPVKRASQRSMSPNQIYESDLRYRLSKQSRVTGSRSVVSPDRLGDFYLRDGHVEEKRQRGYSERGSHHLPSRGNRFHGRIKLPGRLATEKNHNGFILQRKMERGRKWGLRLSPSNPPPSSFHQERHQDRLKQRVQENFISEARNFKGRMIRSYDVDVINLVDFAAPKSLAELKGSKVSVNNREQIMNPLGEKKNTGNEKFVGLEESEGSLPFEGPKPLSMILKRKRGGESVDSGSGIDSGKESERNVTSKTVEEEGLISTGGEKVSHEDHSSYTQKEGDLENEDEMMIDEAMEDEEFDHGEEEEYDYEGDDVEEFKTEEEENAEAEEEYFDDGDDDEEDFAKRIGLLLN